jgi:UDPglucose 6-dehydrogenase
MKVTVFGVGYVGLVQAAVMAEVGHDVYCIDVDAEKIARLQAGHIPIFEPDLDVLVERNVREGRLRFTTDAKAGVEHAGIQFIAVGTPPSDDGSADLTNVTAVARTIAAHMNRPQLIVNKSTVPVGTADLVRDIVTQALAEAGRKLEFDVVSNPEFLKEGSAVADCMRPDRIIVGTGSRQAEALLRQLYAPFNRNHEKMIVMDVRSAELTKYAANCMLATKISFMNEMANIAERLGADIEWVRKGIGSDPRIGYSFIYPGIGYGGSCFPKDVRALIRTAETAGVTPSLLSAVEHRNNAQKQVLFGRIEHYFGGNLRGRTFALWGLAFKPNTDDMREAPARTIMEALWAAGAKVRAYDPEAMGECTRIYGARDDLDLVETREQALEGADALVIATEWNVFRSADFDEIRSQLKHPAIFDGRNVYDPEFMKAQGFDYFAIGRGELDRTIA